MTTLQDSLTAVFQQIGADIQMLRATTGMASSSMRYVGEVSGASDAATACDLSTQLPRDAGCAYSVSQAGWFQLGAEPAFYAPRHSVLIFNPAGGVDVASGANLGGAVIFCRACTALTMPA